MDCKEFQLRNSLLLIVGKDVSAVFVCYVDILLVILLPRVLSANVDIIGTITAKSLGTLTVLFDSYSELPSPPSEQC